MKTASSLPDAIFRRAEQTAKKLKVTRSELSRRALEAFIAGQSAREVTASYDAGLRLAFDLR